MELSPPRAPSPLLNERRRVCLALFREPVRYQLKGSCCSFGGKHTPETEGSPNLELGEGEGGLFETDSRVSRTDFDLNISTGVRLLVGECT